MPTSALNHTPGVTDSTPTPTPRGVTNRCPGNPPTSARADPGPPDIRPARIHPHTLGKRGEDLAAKYLEAAGLVILSRNWRCRIGELDIVATDGNALVVCEVKTRSSEDFGTPAEAVDPTKTLRIRRATHEWLRRYGVPWCPVRFDVLAILWPPNEAPRLEHLRGAFS